MTDEPPSPVLTVRGVRGSSEVSLVKLGLRFSATARGWGRVLLCDGGSDTPSTCSHETGPASNRPYTNRTDMQITPDLHLLTKV